MTPLEEQSGPKSGSQYRRSDDFLDREPQFATSLANTVERPRFVVDPVEGGPAGESSQSGESEPDRTFRIDDKAQEEVRQETPASLSADEVSPPDWRDLVSAKVSNYKSRRPRPQRYPSLQLKFEQKPLVRETRPEVGDHLSGSHYSTTSAAVSDLDARARELDPRLVSEATARVLEFPRQVTVPVGWDELAEPILDRPRIVEAPELVPPPPAMGGILIEPSTQPEPERRPGFDMPLRSSALSRRLTAGLIDALVILLAMVAFGYVFLRVTAAEPSWKTLSELVLVLVAVLWPAYQFALLVFSGTTPGLRLCRLRMERFDGAPVGRKLRACRVLVSLLSAISVGIGYLWCFLDEDQLSWHDRITSTHLADSRQPRESTGP
jgi:uncharacterized RDD family membrane protein YckC